MNLGFNFTNIVIITFMVILRKYNKWVSTVHKSWMNKTINGIGYGTTL